MSVPDSIRQLVQHFDDHLAEYSSGAYNEAQLRSEFLDPFFVALGWDVFNQQGYAEAYKEVIHEDAIKVGGATKAPDLAFRIGGKRIFFVEAKKPAVNIKEEASPAYQLRRYAWSAKLPLSILTDFEEFAVYDCRSKPDPADKASTGRVIYLGYRDYSDKWDEIAAIFSREAVLKGSFDKYAESTRGKHGTAEVDDAFLLDIEHWRVLLAHNIALRNMELTPHELNYAVQMTIDRIIFLRICEDRGIEPLAQLQALLNSGEVYARLRDIYRRADARYNSGLFHFHDENGQADAPDTLTPGLTIDDKPLKEIIDSLYYPASPYEFSVLPAEILGQVYEQFLGKVIHLTAGHHAVIEDKPEVKKAGGVFYTPTYIVDYIVRHTVGALLEGRKPGGYGAGRGEPLRILDPACGSGSFLLGAYQHLLDWYRDGYVAEGVEKWGKGKKPTLYQVRGGEWKLTTAERKRILLEHIHGVDIDPQAVEVTKLSLLLKVLEGESEQTLAHQLNLWQERVLPDLSSNIKCGNSLIGTDFYQRQQMSLLDDEQQYSTNAFDWKIEFADTFAVAGGFDAVIGNPPYVRQEGLGRYKDYFQQHYQVYHGVADLYAYFIEKGVSLLRTGGVFGYIVANKWMRANYGEPLRRWMKKQCIEEITDFGDLPVFERATTYPCILRISRKAPQPNFEVTQVKTLEFNRLEDYTRQYGFKLDISNLDDRGWTLADNSSQALLAKIQQAGIPLGQYVEEKIFRGIITGLNEAFVIDTETRRLIAKDAKSSDLIKPFLIGRDIKRYQPPASSRYIILIPRGWTQQHMGTHDLSEARAWKWLQNEYPALAEHLLPFEVAAKKRYDKGDYWWELRACDFYQEFEKPKIIYPNICKRPEFTCDKSNFYTNQKCFIISLYDEYLLGLLNSSLTFYLFRAILPKLRGDFYEPSYVFLKDFPIRAINFSDPADTKHHDDMVALVDHMLTLHQQLARCKVPGEKTLLQRQIDATDHQIDALVYELYGLTEEEIRVVEGTSQNQEEKPSD